MMRVCFMIHIKNMLVDTETRKYKNVNKHKHYFLADKGYDSNIIRNMLIEKGYYVIIPFNKKNTKNISKIKKYICERKYNLRAICKMLLHIIKFKH